MSNEAAITLKSKVDEVENLKNKEVKRMQDMIDKLEGDASERIKALRQAIREVCTHEDQEPIFVDNTYHDYHNNVERGGCYARCSICGQNKDISDSDYKNKVNPFK